MYGLFEGNATEQADAEMAYNQSYFKGTPTFVRLPYDRWPQKWKDDGMVDPVCPMETSLYGHPESGFYWEEHCDACLKGLGYQLIDEWPGCYWHPKYCAFQTYWIP